MTCIESDEDALQSYVSRKMPIPNPETNKSYIHDRVPHSVPDYKGKSNPLSTKYMDHNPSKNIYNAQEGQYFKDGEPMYLPSYPKEGPITKISKPKSEFLLYDRRSSIIGLSMSLGLLTKDVDTSWLLVFFEWLLAFAVAGVGSFERGGELTHLHVQATAVIHGENCLGALDQIRAHFAHYFDCWSLKKTHICIKILDESAGHCFMPMQGYCLKDWGQPHFEYVTLNLSREVLRAGLQAWRRGKRKSQETRRALNKKNYLEQVAQFCKDNLHGLGALDASRVMVWMISTGTWYLGDDFVSNGGYAVTNERATDQLNARLTGTVTRQQVMMIVFGQEEPYEENTVDFYIDDAPSRFEGRRGMSTERSRIGPPTNRLGITSWYERDVHANMSFGAAKQEAARQRALKGMDETDATVPRPDLNDDDPMAPPQEGETRPLRVALRDFEDGRTQCAGLESYLFTRGFKANDNVRFNEQAEVERLTRERADAHNTPSAREDVVDDEEEEEEKDEEPEEEGE